MAAAWLSHSLQSGTSMLAASLVQPRYAFSALSSPGEATFMRQFIRSSSYERKVPVIPKIKKAFDWSEYGVVSEVRQQGQSPTCYAQAVVRAIEAVYAIKTGESVRLSVQEVVDNLHEGPNIVYERPEQVTGGGSVLKALAWILQNGVSLESDYPAYDGIPKHPPMDYERSMRRLVRIDNFGYHEQVSKQRFIDLLRSQPLIVNLVVGPIFSYYEKGIYYGETYDWPKNHYGGHSLVVVQATHNCFGADNSWGINWGMKGRVYFPHSFEAIRQEVFYPIIY